MEWFEIIGRATVYIIGVLALAYSLVIGLNLLTRHRGMESLPLMIIAFFGTIIIGAIVGLILLGRMLA